MLQRRLRRTLLPVIALLAATCLAGCSVTEPPDMIAPSRTGASATSPPTSESDAEDSTTVLMTPDPQDGEPTTFTFADGESVSKDTEFDWGDGLAHDPGWLRDESKSAPGRWTYVNSAGTCTAAFRMGRLGDAGEMDDRQASAALVAASLNEDLHSFDDLAYDGRFRLNRIGQSWVEHRQFSITINGVGYFSAARAFVKADYDVSVFVTCRGEDIQTVANEVLSKNIVMIDLK